MPLNEVLAQRSWSPGAVLGLPTVPQGRVKCREHTSLWAVHVTNNNNNSTSVLLDQDQFTISLACTRFLLLQDEWSHKHHLLKKQKLEIENQKQKLEAEVLDKETEDGLKWRQEFKVAHSRSLAFGQYCFLVFVSDVFFLSLYLKQNDLNNKQNNKQRTQLKYACLPSNSTC